MALINDLQTENKEEVGEKQEGSHLLSSKEDRLAG